MDIPRNPNLYRRPFDLCILGGGITGLFLAWEAARRGLSVFLLEKDDFGSKTSAATSKLIHGGLRYLRQLDIAVVKESLAERRRFQEIAPHLVRPIEHLLLVEKGVSPGKALLGIGMKIYRLLAYDRYPMRYADAYLPPPRWLPRNHLSFSLPPSYLGAYRYYDCFNPWPNRLNIEIAKSAVSDGAVLINYLMAKDLQPSQGGYRVLAKDRLNNADWEIESRAVIDATGPWADHFLQKFTSYPKRFRRSIGIHLIAKNRHFPHARALLGKNTHNHRHIFAIPWRRHWLLGTTDEEFPNDPDSLEVSEQRKKAFFELVQQEFPFLQLGEEDIVSSYAGLRMLEDDEGQKTYELSRKSEIIEHRDYQGMPHVYTVIGGKYTTARALAERSIDLVCKRLGLCAPSPCSLRPVDSSIRMELDSFIDYACQCFPQVDPKILIHLVHFYGSHFYRLLEDKPRRLFPQSEDFWNIDAEIEHAIRDEMAFTLKDLLLRRLEIASLYLPPRRKIVEIAKKMAYYLDWDQTRIEEEVESVCGSSPQR